MWDSATPANVDFADGAYFHNFETLRYFATGSGNDSITQRGRVDNLFYLGAGDDTVNPGLGVDTVDGGAGFDKLSADFGNETQAITFIGGDTTADIANPTDAFHELFAPEFTIDADTTHDAWHHDAAPAPFDFDVMDAMV